MIDKVKIWEEAETIAQRRAPSPPYDSKLAGLTAAVAAACVAMVALNLAGAPERTVGMITYWMGAIIGVCVWLFFRAQEKQHSNAFSAAYKQLIEDAEANEAAETDKAAREDAASERQR